MGWLEAWQRRLVAGVQDRLGPAAVCLALFAMGVVFGALAVGAVGSQDRAELALSVRQLVRGMTLSGPPLPPAREFGYTVAAGLQALALWWALGITVVGSLAVLGLLFLRGFATGFAAGLLGAELGWRGTVLAAAALLPYEALAAPATVLAAAGAVHFSLQILRGPVRVSRALFYRELRRYTAWMAGAGLALVAAGLARALLAPHLMLLAGALLGPA